MNVCCKSNVVLLIASLAAVCSVMEWQLIRGSNVGGLFVGDEQDARDRILLPTKASGYGLDSMAVPNFFQASPPVDEDAAEKLRSLKGKDKKKKNKKNGGFKSRPASPPKQVVPAIDLNNKNMDTQQSTASKWQSNRDVVHVIHTRLWQYQSYLIELGKARLDLFETFTLPSVSAQTNQQFLYVIHANPFISPEMRKVLVDSVQANMQNAVILADNHWTKNTDFRLYDVTKLRKMIWTSPDTFDLLAEYVDAAQSRLLIETSLDADDSLSKNFVSSVQTYVRSQVVSVHEEHIRVLCPEFHTEWRFYKPAQKHLKGPAGQNLVENVGGHMIQYVNPSFCGSSGYTVITARKATPRKLWSAAEICNLVQELDPCDPNDAETIQVLQNVFAHHLDNAKQEQLICRDLLRISSDSEGGEASQSAVLMSKTPTAAGMKRVSPYKPVFGAGKNSKALATYEHDQRQAWDHAQTQFSVNSTRVAGLYARLKANMQPILVEALKGQCSKGHSCKEEAKNDLLKLLKEERKNAHEANSNKGT